MLFLISFLAHRDLKGIVESRVFDIVCQCRDECSQYYNVAVDLLQPTRRTQVRHRVQHLKIDFYKIDLSIPD